MATEIERKFLVKNSSWKTGEGVSFKQGYLSTEPDRSVRVRVASTKGYLTIKGRTTGMSRSEFEYEIPVKDAESMLAELCQGPIIEKTRYLVKVENVLYEIDEFSGENYGLTVAEVELKDESQAIPKPDWLGEEVTGDPRYYNASLVNHPFKDW